MYKGYTDARKRANKKYNKANYEQIRISVRKGRKKEYLKAAERRGMSLASFVMESMDEYIANHPYE